MEFYKHGYRLVTAAQAHKIVKHSPQNVMALHIPSRDVFICGEWKPECFTLRREYCRTYGVFPLYDSLKIDNTNSDSRPDDLFIFLAKEI
jgi:hypothetical protein